MDILTQKDIDALVVGEAASGPAEVAIPYNFRRPPKMPRERIIMLETIHARFAMALQSALSNSLHHPADVSVSSVELVTSREFLMSLGSPCAAFVFDLGPRVGAQLIFDLDARFATYVIDRMFGGAGEGGDESRVMTALEQLVLSNLAGRIGGLLKEEAWGEHLAMEPVLTSFESNTETMNLGAQEDIALVVNMVVKSGAGVGAVTLSLPLSALESFLQDRSGPAHHPAPKDESAAAVDRKVMSQQVLSAAIPVVARMPVVWIPALEIAALHVGQVIPTGQSTQSPVELHINGRRLFLGTLGKHLGKVGFQVSEAVEPTATATRSHRRNSFS